MPKIEKEQPARRSPSPIRPAVNKGTGAVARIAPMSVADVGIKLCVYGHSGTGKTTLWSTFPAPILAVICSGGKDSDELRSIDTAENRARVSSVTLEASTELRDIIEYAKGADLGTVVLDHATGLEDMVLAEILGMAELPAQKYWGLATQDQYGQLGLQMKEYLRAILSLRCNVVVVAQERVFKTEGVSAELVSPNVGPWLSPKTSGWLNTACGYVVQTFKKRKEVVKRVKVNGEVTEVRELLTDVEYCLRTGPDPVYITKFRQPKTQQVPTAIMDPDYHKIMSVVSGG